MFGRRETPTATCTPNATATVARPAARRAISAAIAEPPALCKPKGTAVSPAPTGDDSLRRLGGHRGSGQKSGQKKEEDQQNSHRAAPCSTDSTYLG